MLASLVVGTGSSDLRYPSPQVLTPIRGLLPWLLALLSQVLAKSRTGPSSPCGKLPSLSAAQPVIYSLRKKGSLSPQFKPKSQGDLSLAWLGHSFAVCGIEPKPGNQCCGTALHRVRHKSDQEWQSLKGRWGLWWKRRTCWVGRNNHSLVNTPNVIQAGGRTGVLRITSSAWRQSLRAWCM